VAEPGTPGTGPEVSRFGLIGSRVSHYAIANLIGSGGMGEVYRARDERLRRDVAIKVVGRDAASRPRMRRKAMAEARALSRLSHPHVASVYDFVTEAGRDFIVMEYVSGATLKAMVAGGPLPFAEVLRLGEQLARGLAAAHAALVVHCDIKPTNLKVTPRGDLKIIDFGLARLQPSAALLDASTATPVGFEPAGTLAYMAPEQLRGDAVDERSDIFSAGAVLYEMATGRRAFPQTQLAQLIDAILNQDPIALSAVNPFLPVSFERLVARTLEKDPDQRFQGATELADALGGLASGRVSARRLTLRSWVAGLVR
jgi:serine/threonine protein kinase